MLSAVAGHRGAGSVKILKTERLLLKTTGFQASQGRQHTARSVASNHPTATCGAQLLARALTDVVFLTHNTIAQACKVHHEQRELCWRARGRLLDGRAGCFPHVDLNHDLAWQGGVVLELCNDTGLVSFDVYFENIQGSVLVAQFCCDLLPCLEARSCRATHTPL